MDNLDVWSSQSSQISRISQSEQWDQLVSSIKSEQQNQLEQWDQSNEYSDIITCMNIEMYYVWTFKCVNIQMYDRAIGSGSHLNNQTIKYCDI